MDQTRFPLRRCILRLAWMSLSLLLLAATGCRTFSGPASASFASVTIQNHTSEKIAIATAEVFNADGYQGLNNSTGEMLFEKEASRATGFARDGLVNTYNGSRTINRVRVQIVPLSSGAFRLQCQAYMVSGGSDPFFQDEVPLTNIRSGPYQSLLNKVAKQLR